MPAVPEELGPCITSRHQRHYVSQSGLGCKVPRIVPRAWGSIPREGPPDGACPIRVELIDGVAVAASATFASSFDPLPWTDCIPEKAALGGRKVVAVSDGYLVAYPGLSEGETAWLGAEGKQRRKISTARVVGFARAPSGAILGLAIGRARLGRGGVLAFERTGPGVYVPRLIASLPLEPRPVSFDDGGVLVGIAQGFLFRVDERGALENVHYLPRDIGRVTSIAKSVDGVYYLGLECGVLRLVPGGRGEDGRAVYREEWWSARSGASGRWSPCVRGSPAPSAAW